MDEPAPTDSSARTQGTNKSEAAGGTRRMGRYVNIQGAAAERGAGASVVGFDDLRRHLDDEDFFAAVRIDLDHPVQEDALVVLHGHHAVDEDVFRERLVFRRGGNAGLQRLDVPAMQLHRRLLPAASAAPCVTRKANALFIYWIIPFQSSTGFVNKSLQFCRFDEVKFLPDRRSPAVYLIYCANHPREVRHEQGG